MEVNTAFQRIEKGCDFGFVDLIFNSDILQLLFNLFAGVYLDVETPAERDQDWINHEER